jgi:hypothetical protein
MNQSNRQQRPNTLNSTRRFSVRLALATGATMATLLGSQTLALLEEPATQKLIQATLASTDAATNAPGPVATAPTQLDKLVQPTRPLPPSAPILVVIRNPGAVPTLLVTPGATPLPPSNPSRSADIVPPKPVAVQVPPQQQPPAAVGQPAAPGPSAVVVQPAPAQPAPVSQPSRR